MSLNLFSPSSIVLAIRIHFPLWSNSSRGRALDRAGDNLTQRNIRRARINEQYMWATRMSHAPNMPSTETHFYQQAIVHLDASAATGDRLMDCIRAAYLLSAFQYMNGRHHSVSFLPCSSLHFCHLLFLIFFFCESHDLYSGIPTMWSFSSVSPLSDVCE